MEWSRKIAIINVGSKASKAKMSKWVKKWEAEKKKRGAVEIVPPRHSDYW
jgi:DNA cross-link repair 1A protein